MITYLRIGAHAKANAVFPKIATGKVLDLSLDDLPDWPELRQLLEEQGGSIQTPLSPPQPRRSSTTICI